jgi:hypothetical protein
MARVFRCYIFSGCYFIPKKKWVRMWNHNNTVNQNFDLYNAPYLIFTFDAFFEIGKNKSKITYDIVYQ